MCHLLLNIAEIRHLQPNRVGREVPLQSGRDDETAAGSCRASGKHILKEDCILVDSAKSVLAFKCDCLGRKISHCLGYKTGCCMDEGVWSELESFIDKNQRCVSLLCIVKLHDFLECQSNRVTRVA